MKKREGWQMSRTRFIPKVGTTYRNHGGGEYECIAIKSDGNAWMRNVVSGWTFLAHYVVMYESGAIEWDYSSDGFFFGG